MRLIVLMMIFGQRYLHSADVFQTESLYRKSLAKVMHDYQKNGFPLKVNFQQSLWLEKIASLNFFCAMKNSAGCRKMIFWAVRDSSLIVRDHAFVIMKNSPHFQPDEIYSVAAEARDDNRNFRHGQPLWIVDRTDRYLRQIESRR